MFDNNLYFASSDRHFSVSIKTEVANIIVDTAIRAKGKETGGILIGQIDRNGQAIISEATSKPRGSKFTWRTFVRAPTGLAGLLRSRWAVRQHYLGEWHSHPGSSPQPSGQDCASMNSIAADDQYDCKEPILMIVGTKVGGPELSVTVFPRGRESVQLHRLAVAVRS